MDAPAVKTLEENRAEILAARSTQASHKLKQLLKKDVRLAWDYFAQLCDGPDVNEFHCAIMLRVCESLGQVQRVLMLMERTGVQANSVICTYA